MKKRKFKILTGIILFLVGVRIILPSVLLSQINKYLNNLDANYVGHVQDLDLSIIRGAYKLEGIEFELRESNEKFIEIDMADVSIAWREVIRGKILSDIIFEQPKIIFSQNRWDKLLEKKSKNIESAESAGNKLFPILLTSIKINDGKFEYIDRKNRSIIISNINGETTNVYLAGDEPNERPYYKLNATLPTQGQLNLSGSFAIDNKSVDWSSRLKIENLKLPDFNNWVSDYVQLTFNHGTLDLFAKGEGKNSDFKASIKPFLRNLDIMSDKKDFKSIKHFGIEFLVAIVNLVFQNRSSRDLAFYLPFEYQGGKFDADYWAMIKSMYENGFIDELDANFDVPDFISKKKDPARPWNFNKKI